MSNKNIFNVHVFKKKIYIILLNNNNNFINNIKQEFINN
jgi:hypothetical protein